MPQICLKGRFLSLCTQLTEKDYWSAREQGTTFLLDQHRFVDTCTDIDHKTRVCYVLRAKRRQWEVETTPAHLLQFRPQPCLAEHAISPMYPEKDRKGNVVPLPRSKQFAWSTADQRDLAQTIQSVGFVLIPTVPLVSYAATVEPLLAASIAGGFTTFPREANSSFPEAAMMGAI